MKNRKKYENELEQRLWNEGWATFRVAGSGSVEHESADLTAVKNGRTLIIEVKTTNRNLENEDCVKYNYNQLGEIRDRTGDYEYIETIYALRNIGGSGTKWYYRTLRNDEIKPLYKILKNDT